MLPKLFFKSSLGSLKQPAEAAPKEQPKDMAAPVFAAACGLAICCLGLSALVAGGVLSTIAATLLYSAVFVVAAGVVLAAMCVLRRRQGQAAYSKIGVVLDPIAVETALSRPTTPQHSDSDADPNANDSMIEHSDVASDSDSD